jgi:Domain of Unknown Function (DUF928)
MKAAKLFFFIPIILTSVIFYSLLVLAESSQQGTSNLPSPPDTGTPEGEISPGGTRIDKNSTCQTTKKSLTSLLAVGDFTLSEYPSFWFYIPYTSEEINYLEFTLKDTLEYKTLYRTAIQVTDKPGIIKIPIPSEEKYALAPQNNYNWNLVVYCTPNQTNVPDIILNGSIRRLPVTSQLKEQLNAVKSEEYLVYIDHYIYYDAVTNLVALRIANSNSDRLNRAWGKLLELLGRKELVGEPIVDISLVEPQEYNK